MKNIIPILFYVKICSTSAQLDFIDQPDSFLQEPCTLLKPLNVLPFKPKHRCCRNIKTHYQKIFGIERIKWRDFCNKKPLQMKPVDVNIQSMCCNDCDSFREEFDKNLQTKSWVKQ